MPNMFFIGIDENERLVITPHTWKYSQNQVLWPPKAAKDVTKLVKYSTKPNLDWIIYECRWLNVTAGKIMELYLC